MQWLNNLIRPILSLQFKFDLSNFESKITNHSFGFIVFILFLFNPAFIAAIRNKLFGF